MSTNLQIEPINRFRLSQQVMLQICDLIRENRLTSGDRLPAERELAQRLGVSRTSLREALTGLEMAGIIASRHGGGTWVRNGLEFGVTSPLALALRASDDSVSDLLEVRLIFEPIVAAQAALRATDADIAAMRSATNRLGTLVDDLADRSDQILALDRQFHSAIANATGNRVVIRVLQLINELLVESKRHFIADRDQRELTFVRHSEIVDAIEKHDPRSARFAMLRHLQEVESRIFEFIEQASEASEPATAVDDEA